ncbi:MAG: NUDIX hydrolase [Polyangiaceae bacterium]
MYAPAAHGIPTFRPRSNHRIREKGATVNGLVTKIPELPRIGLVVGADVSLPNGGKYLRLRHPELRLAYPSGSKSDAFTYDMIVRDALDAAVVIAHYQDQNRTMIYLRSCVRPPVGLRQIEPKYDPSMWEVVAGLVELGEDPREAAVRELEEEIGAKVSSKQMLDLGHPTFPSPGVLGERHIYFHVEVDPKSLATPGEDGSALEREASIVAVSLDDALAWVRSGEIVDAKTETALRRLKEAL